MALGLLAMGLEGARELRVAGELRRRAHLRERLDLHGVDVGEVLDKLFAECAGRHTTGLPSFSPLAVARSPAGPAAAPPPRPCPPAGRAAGRRSPASRP